MKLISWNVNGLHRVYLFCREEGLLRHGLLVP